MKAAILNGFSANDHESRQIHDALMAEFVRRHWQITSFSLCDLRIIHCQGCFECWTKRPGLCKFKDDGQRITREIITSNLIVPFTPVTFGGYSAELKKAIDRALCLISPFLTMIDGEIHHQKRYDRYPYWLSIGIMPRPDAESERIFKNLTRRNAINLHTTAFSEVFCLNTSPDDIRLHECLQAVFDNLEAGR